MKFTVSQSSLARAINVVSKGIGSQSSLPILTGILISAGAGTIQLQTTNLNVSIRHALPANVEEEGATVVSGKLLGNMVKNLPAEATLELVGHADKETGNPRHNRKLSEQRVQTVFRALLEMGFCGKMTYEAKGDTANPFDDPFVKNRCVTVKIHVPVVAE